MTVPPMNPVDDDVQLAGLLSETAAFDELAAGLTFDELDQPAPTPGCTVGHRVARLAAVFHMVALSITDPSAFRGMGLTSSADLEVRVRAAASAYLLEPPGALVIRWNAEYRAGVDALTSADVSTTHPWPGAQPTRADFVDGLLVDLYSHARDIADAIDRAPERTEQTVRAITGAVLRRAVVATPDGTGPAFELVGPSGAEWTVGAPDAASRVRGTADDLCNYLTGRRDADRVELHVESGAGEWLEAMRSGRTELAHDDRGGTRAA